MEQRIIHQKALKMKLKNFSEIILYQLGMMGQSLMIKLFRDGLQAHPIYQRLN